jgi:RNase P subunit RPR2
MSNCQHDFHKTEEVKFDEQTNEQIVKVICKKCGKVKWTSVNALFEEHKYDKNHSIVDGY